MTDPLVTYWFKDSKNTYVGYYVYKVYCQPTGTWKIKEIDGEKELYIEVEWKETLPNVREKKLKFLWIFPRTVNEYYYVSSSRSNFIKSVDLHYSIEYPEQRCTYEQ